MPNPYLEAEQALNALCLEMRTCKVMFVATCDLIHPQGTLYLGGCFAFAQRLRAQVETFERAFQALPVLPSRDSPISLKNIRSSTYTEATLFLAKSLVLFFDRFDPAQNRTGADHDDGEWWSSKRSDTEARQIFYEWSDDVFDPHFDEVLFEARLNATNELRKASQTNGVSQPGTGGRNLTSTERRHSPDFASVLWDGSTFEFSPTQAACVHVLWVAMENGTPALAQETIIEAAGTDTPLRTVFQGHEAWNVMIVAGAKKGHFRLSPAIF